MICDIWLHRNPPSRISCSRSYRYIPVRSSFQEVFLFWAVPGFQAIPVLTWKTMWKNKQCEEFRVWFFPYLRLSRFTFSFFEKIVEVWWINFPNQIASRLALVFWLMLGILRYTSTVITALMISLICSLHQVSQQDEQQFEDVDQLFAPTLALLCVAGLYLLFVWSNACCDEEKRDWK